MTDKTLTVTTDKQRREWIELLELGVEYHNEIAEEIDDDDSIKFHTGLSRAILESIWLLEIWEVEDNSDPYTTAIQSISKDYSADEKKDDFIHRKSYGDSYTGKKIWKNNESTPNSDD
tara:strand:- start:266 stop:619 length:354 start_codon:yes stop_codon:yes gene_type:complete